MGIDVYATDLAAQLRNVDGGTASALRRGERHPLTARGLQACSTAAGRRPGALGPFSALLLAWQVTRELAVDAGSPFAARGPFMHQEPDKLDAEQWHLLQAVMASTDRGIGIDESLSAIDREAIFDIGFLDPSWDELPGIAFARAVEHANTLVLPGDGSSSFAVGHLAVTSVGEGRAFLRALLERLSLTMAVLEEEYDAEMSDGLNGVLYNPRLLAFHLDRAARSGRPLGIWG